MLDLICHQFSFTANSLEYQPTISQYFEPLTLQILALAADSIHCVLAEHDSGMKATVTIAHDEYCGTFCPTPVINFSLGAAEVINHTLVVSLISPLSPNFGRICAPQSSSVLISQDWPCVHFIPHSILLLPSLLCWGRHSRIPFV